MGKKEYIGPGIFICLGIFIWVYTWHFPVVAEAGSRHPRAAKRAGVKKLPIRIA